MKEEIIKVIISILEKVDDEEVLHDMKAMIQLLYNNYIIGK